MKITVNGKKHELGKSLGRETCKIGPEKLSMLAGIDLNKVQMISFKHKCGSTGFLVDSKTVAHEGSVFTLTTQESDKSE